MLFSVLVVFHVLVCIGLILVVLLQSSKGEGLAGSAFGGGGGSLSGAVFGGRGAATFLSKATSVLAILFMVNCIALAYMSAGDKPTMSGAVSGDGTSVVTEKAQAERERALQQQQLQQTNQAGDSAVQINILPDETAGDDTTGQ